MWNVSSKAGPAQGLLLPGRRPKIADIPLGTPSTVWLSSFNLLLIAASPTRRWLSTYRDLSSVVEWFFAPQPGLDQKRVDVTDEVLQGIGVLVESQSNTIHPEV